MSISELEKERLTDAQLTDLAKRRHMLTKRRESAQIIQLQWKAHFVLKKQKEAVILSLIWKRKLKGKEQPNKFRESSDSSSSKPRPTFVSFSFSCE